MKLYYVRADTDDGDNLDLLVWATTKEEAITVWQTHYALDADDVDPYWVGVIPTDAPTTPTAIDWSQIN